jgi:hypothetical protein
MEMEDKKRKGAKRFSSCARPLSLSLSLCVCVCVCVVLGERYRIPGEEGSNSRLYNPPCSLFKLITLISVK